MEMKIAPTIPAILDRARDGALPGLEAAMTSEAAVKVDLPAHVTSETARRLSGFEQRK